MLKPVDNLEDSQFVIVENKRCVYKSKLLKTEDYKTLERGEPYPPDIVYFFVNSNKRNVQNINNRLVRHRKWDLVYPKYILSKLSPSVFGVHRIYLRILYVPRYLIRQGLKRSKEEVEFT